MKFTKMQATGNDFVLLDARGLRRAWAKLAQQLCHRHLGVGADGLLLVLPSRKANFRMRMFNPDGSEAESCGNGLRCLGKYLVDEGLVKSRQFMVETKAGVARLKIGARLRNSLKVTVSMGMPRLRAEEIPVALEGEKFHKSPILDYPLTVKGKRLALSFVSMGNPHAVAFLEEPVDSFPLTEVGPEVEHLPLFPQRTNFEIVNKVDRHHLNARVWERGAGETLSCGTGACAIAVAARLKGYMEDKIDIALPGGTLSLQWDGQGEVFLTGQAVEVFEGEWIE